MENCCSKPLKTTKNKHSALRRNRYTFVDSYQGVFYTQRMDASHIVGW